MSQVIRILQEMKQEQAHLLSVSNELRTQLQAQV